MATAAETLQKTLSAELLTENKRTLNEAELNAYARLIAEHATPRAQGVAEPATGAAGVVAILPNQRHGMAGDRPAGATVIVNKTAPVVPEMLDDRLFGQLVVVRVVDANEQALARAVNKVGAELAAAAPGDAYSLERCYAKPATGIVDAAPWHEWLGGHGNFVGAYKQERAGAAPALYVAVQTDAGDAGAELKQHLRKRIAAGAYTYAQMLDDPRFGAVRLASERNAQRIAARVAREAGARFTFADDLFARVNTESFEAAPELAVPHVQMEFNTLKPVVDRAGTTNKYVAYYDRAAPVAAAVEFLALPSSPTEGLRLVSVDAKRVPADPNVRVVGLPYGLERRDDDAAEAARRRMHTLARTEPETNAYLQETFTWSGRSNLAHDHPALWRYEPFAAETHGRLLSALLGPSAATATLKPVRVWLAPK